MRGIFEFHIDMQKISFETSVEIKTTNIIQWRFLHTCSASGEHPKIMQMVFFFHLDSSKYKNFNKSSDIFS